MSYSQTIPDDVAVEDISAYCVDGILTVRLPKSRESQTVEIEVVNECLEMEEKSNEWIQVALFNVPGVPSKDISVNATPGYLKVCCTTTHLSLVALSYASPRLRCADSYWNRCLSKAHKEKAESNGSGML